MKMEAKRKQALIVLILFGIVLMVGCGQKKTVTFSDTSLAVSGNETESSGEDMSEGEGLSEDEDMSEGEGLSDSESLPKSEAVQMQPNESMQSMMQEQIPSSESASATEDLPTPEPDAEAPVIEGVSDITINVGDTISYRKNISVTDNSGEKIQPEIDNSAVKPEEPGNYPVTYTARDSAGNVTTVQATVIVLAPPTAKEEEVNALADQVIAEITTPEMSDWDKAYATWDWCRTKIKYSYTSGDRSSVYAGAYEGFVKKRGDCYTYYATYEILLNRLGIENMCVDRVGGESNHWWNLVNLGDGWYHCDSSPRKKEHTYKCFMQTDAQIQAYSDFYVEHPDYYTFDKELYPERGTEVVFESKPDGVRIEAVPSEVVQPEATP